MRLDVELLYRLHTPFVIAFLAFVAVFIAVHLKERKG